MGSTTCFWTTTDPVLCNSSFVVMMYISNSNVCKLPGTRYFRVLPQTRQMLPSWVCRQIKYTMARKNAVVGGAASKSSPKEAEWSPFLFCLVNTTRQRHKDKPGLIGWKWKGRPVQIRGLIHLPDNLAHSGSGEDWQPTNHCAARVLHD